MTIAKATAWPARNRALRQRFDCRDPRGERRRSPAARRRLTLNNVLDIAFVVTGYVSVDIAIA
jgi:hypothetical protein